MSAIILDFNVPLKFLDNSVVMEPAQNGETPNTPIMINKMLATNLSQGREGGMKVYYWAIELYKEGKLMLDKPDRELFKKTIESMGTSILVQGRVLEILEEAEKLAATPPKE